MTSTSYTLVPRLVRILSNVHAVKRGGAVADFALTKAFSKQHFPKTLAVTCIMSFGIGFCGMNRWQQNRQWEWERRQEELEAQFFKVHTAKKDPKLPQKPSVDRRTI